MYDVLLFWTDREIWLQNSETSLFPNEISPQFVATELEFASGAHSILPRNASNFDKQN